jgi:hypothetical protein
MCARRFNETAFASTVRLDARVTRVHLRAQKREDVGVVQRAHHRDFPLHGGVPEPGGSRTPIALVLVLVLVLAVLQKHALEREVLPARVRHLADQVHVREPALPQRSLHREPRALHGHLLRGHDLFRRGV